MSERMAPHPEPYIDPYIGQRPRQAGDEAFIRMAVARELLGDATPADLGPLVEEFIPAPYTLTLLAFVHPALEPPTVSVKWVEVRASGFTRPADGSIAVPERILTDAVGRALHRRHAIPAAD